MRKLIVEIENMLHSEFKVECAKNEKSQKEILTRLIEGWLEKHSNKKGFKK